VTDATDAEAVGSLYIAESPPPRCHTRTSHPHRAGNPAPAPDRASAWGARRRWSARWPSSTRSMRRWRARPTVGAVSGESPSRLRSRKRPDWPAKRGAAPLSCSCWPGTSTWPRGAPGSRAGAA
jgi:hypothetical protein